MNPSMGGQAKACPTKRADFLRGGACFSLPSHGACGIWLKSFSPGSPKTRGDFRSSESRRGTQECVRHGLVCEVIVSPPLSRNVILLAPVTLAASSNDRE